MPVTQETQCGKKKTIKINTVKHTGITLARRMQTMTNFWGVLMSSNLAETDKKICYLSFLVANKFEFLTCPLVPFSQDTQLAVCPITSMRQPLIPSALEQEQPIQRMNVNHCLFLFGFPVAALIMSVVSLHEKHHLSVSFISTA